MRSMGPEMKKKIRSKERVLLMGVELEGGWSTEKASKFVVKREDGLQEIPFHHDASLRDEPLTSADHYGEIVSEPLPVEAAANWTREHWPEVVNSWCGMHIHASFRTPTDYRFLMEKEFYPHFLQEMAAWGKKVGLPNTDPFWGRLAGQNRYCANRFQPEMQVNLMTKQPRRGRDGEEAHPRRTILNYSWAMHKTLECRVFPVWGDPEIGVKAVEGLAGIYNSYLNARWEKGYKEITATKLVLKSDMTWDMKGGRRPLPAQLEER